MKTKDKLGLLANEAAKEVTAYGTAKLETEQCVTPCFVERKIQIFV
jgi:hypothetical protein